MKALCEGLVRMRVRPYYCYQAQLLEGTAHFRVPIERGIELFRALRGRTSGFAIPQYVLDTPHGKVPLAHPYLRGREGDYVVVEAPDGRALARAEPGVSGARRRILAPGGSIAGPSADAGARRRAALLLAASVLPLARARLRARGGARPASARGARADAYNAAFQLPDLLNHLLAGGALSIAFLPLYERAPGQRGAPRAERLLATVLGTIARRRRWR